MNRDDNLPEKQANPFFEISEIGFKPLWNLVHQMDAYFNQIFDQLDTSLIASPFEVDTYENDTDVIVEVKLPGCTRNQIQLEILGDKLRIGIVNSILEEINSETHTGRKQFYQRREHLIPLPFTISEKEALANFHDEVLKITVPKTNIRRRYLTIDE